jgi:hypothetical protein
MTSFMTVPLFSLFVASLSSAGLLFQYHQLTLMDLDQMTKMVQEKLQESKKTAASTVPLKEALQAVYSRPDGDRMIDKVVAPLRLELQDINQYERVLTELVEEALNALKQTQNFKPSVQVTYALFLENLLADSRAVAAGQDGFERNILRKIKKAKIQITKQALNERAVRGIPEAKSPSEIASEILEAIEKADSDKSRPESPKEAPAKEKLEKEKP